MEEKIKKIFEDDYILVVDKPSGLIVNRSLTAKSGTLQDMLMYEYPQEDIDSEEEFSQRTGIVHRLDKDTSGVMIIAKDKDTFSALQTQFKERKARKEYIAVVIGLIIEPIIEINAPIQRNPKDRLRYAVVENGKEAVTLIEKIGNSVVDGQEYTLLTIKPKTGRTHQIRVHLAALGNPIAGDKIYCTSKQLEISGKKFNRLMLHASKLSIMHPHTGIIQTYESKIPSEFSI